MNYFLAFASDFFTRSRIRTAFCDFKTPLADLDFGLRKTILKDTSGHALSECAPELSSLLKRHFVCFLVDLYGCTYILIPVPENDNSVFLAGPYLQESPNIYTTQELCRRRSIPVSQTSYLNQYFSTLHVVSDQGAMENFVSALAVSLYGEENNAVQYVRESEETAVKYTSQSPDVGERKQQAAQLEYRYEMEEEMMNAIARGDAIEARRFSDQIQTSGLDQRTGSSLRSRKNYMIILNTLCRKGAQRGNVHPIYLDELSRRFAIRIEELTTLSEVSDLRNDMLRKYSMLVQTNSTKGYSPIIQKVVNYISINLASEDLTPSSIADFYSLNHSYLSTLFKKETGQTIVHYINGRRIDYAIYLLNTQGGSIQETADACGIPNLTYFTRVFKAEKGMTPSEYRKMIRG